MIDVTIERFSDFIPEFDRLCVEHWKEIARNRDFVPLKPDYDKYRGLDDAGLMCCSTAREGGTLVGYCINFIMPHLHYSATIFGTNDLLFVTKSRRSMMVGSRLLSAAMNEMKSRGAEIFHMHAKSANDIRPLMDRLGFTHIENIYERVL